MNFIFTFKKNYELRIRVLEARKTSLLIFDLFVSFAGDESVSVQIDNEHMTDDVYCRKKNTVNIYHNGNYKYTYTLSEQEFKPLVDFLRNEGYKFSSEDDTTDEGYFSYQIKN